MSQAKQAAKPNGKFDLQRGVDFPGITCVFYCHDGNGKILLHKRSAQCRDEHGRWDAGAGSLEFGEDFEATIRREIKEEYCTDVLEMNFVTVRSVVREHEGKKTHWIALLYAVKVDPEKVAIGDPVKMDDIGWFKEGELPEPLHSQFQKHFDIVKKTGIF